MAKFYMYDMVRKALSLMAQSRRRTASVAESSPTTISLPSRVGQNGGFGSSKLKRTLFRPVCLKEKGEEHVFAHMLLVEHVSQPLSLAETVSSMPSLCFANSEIALGFMPLTVVDSREDNRRHLRCPWIRHNLTINLGYQIWQRGEQRTRLSSRTENAKKTEEKAGGDVQCCGVCSGSAKCRLRINNSRQPVSRSVEVATRSGIIVQAENPAIVELLESATSCAHLLSLLPAAFSMLIKENTELKANLAQKDDEIKDLRAANTPKPIAKRPVNVVRPLPRRENINTMSEQRPASELMLMCPACKERMRSCSICDERGSRCTGCYQCASNAFPNCPFCDEEHTVTNIIRFVRMDNTVVWR